MSFVFSVQLLGREKTRKVWEFFFEKGLYLFLPGQSLKHGKRQEQGTGKRMILSNR